MGRCEDRGVIMFTRFTYHFFQIVWHVKSVILVLIGLLVIKDWQLPFYSLIIIFLVGKVVDTTLQGSMQVAEGSVVTDIDGSPTGFLAPL